MKYGLDEIKAFLAVVESGSISGASNALGGVPPWERGLSTR